MGVMRQMLGQIDHELRKAPEGVSRLPLDTLLPATDQPRRFFAPDSLQSLAESIRQHGVLEPLLVRPIEGGRYQIVAGERRWRAARMAGLEVVPVVVRPMDDRMARTVSLVENLQRDDLNPYEQTQGILDLLSLTLEASREEVAALLHRMHNEKQGRVTRNVSGNSEATQVEEVFRLVGGLTWESFVQARLPLLKLPEDLQVALQEGRIPYTAALELRRLPDPGQRATLVEEAAAGLSLRELRARIRAALQQPHPIQPIYASTLQRLEARILRLPSERRAQAKELLEKVRQDLARLEDYLEARG